MSIDQPGLSPYRPRAGAALVGSGARPLWCAGGDRRRALLDVRDQRRRLAHLLEDHGDLSAAIDAMQALGSPDQLALARLKKRKLMLKDEIMMIQDQLIPDIIA